MKSVSFVIKKKVVNDFYNTLKDRLENSYFKLDSLQYLSKIKVYKLLKLSFQVEGRSFDKKALKDIALLLSKINFKGLSKKDVKSIYKTLLNRDIYDLVEKMLGNIYFALFNIIEFKINTSTSESKYVTNVFKQLGILII